MIIDNTMSKTFIERLKERSKDRESKHISSGKLSASILGQPTQWQILKTIGTAPEEFDDYTLCKFERGRDVEDKLINNMLGLVETQREVEYRGVVGLVDAVVDTRDYQFKCGVIPHEIKSVSNAKYKRIMGRSGGADRSHLLQGALYGLAMGTEHFGLDYISTDDYNLNGSCAIYDTADYKEEIDGIIDAYNEALANKIVPAFQSDEKWMSSPNYNKFYEFFPLDEKQIIDLLKTKYPESYKKLMEG